MKWPTVLPLEATKDALSLCDSEKSESGSEKQNLLLDWNWAVAEKIIIATHMNRGKQEAYRPVHKCHQQDQCWRMDQTFHFNEVTN